MGSNTKRARDDTGSSPDVRTPATTPNPTTSTTKPLSLKQQCFLQALLSRGMMVVDDAEELYREIEEDSEANAFSKFWGDVAIALRFCDLNIRTVKYEDDGKTYMAVVNEGATEVAKLATRLSPEEIALFRVTLDEILRDDESADRGVEFMTALNYTELQPTQATRDGDTQLTQLEKQTQTVQKMSKTDKEAALNQLVDERWLSRVDGGRRLKLGPRTFLELREFVLDQAPENARKRWDKLM
ncbi:Non-structural maintenance of chromosomes element 1 [Ostreococcus tauri]|uniref:Non-structural maintenance of chromosomes element 1 homolog n=1 Tax=Ostreococcus tauri TaxID=70448 RepID=A0A090N3U7_OSTTA|nr:Non-structural maintenance of chromosomes element 1 [Ostreococcus tauri]CEF98738.1 Non-structural maintenance of chromosomes element 1 [Ostreococcus tauri]|eukprot:XP_022839437.1 Non-structural maintenance of chromosomes element 1 [Ostreococcus tauri]